MPVPFQVPQMNALPPKRFSSEDDIVITGFGAVCALGNSVREIWQGLVSNRVCAALSEDSDCSAFGCLAAPVTNLLNIKTDVHPQLSKTMGKHLSLLLQAAEEALEHSGIRACSPPPEELGFFAGMGMVDYHIEDLLPAVLKSLTPRGDLDYDRFFSGGYREIYPLWPLGMLNNVAFCQAAIHFGLRGENCVFSPHGNAGIQAIAEAVKILREGKAKAALTGGVSEEISPLSLARAMLKGVIGPGGSEAEVKGERAGGVFLGEGAAMLVLEPLALAEQRGAKPLGRIAGYGFASEKGAEGKSVSAEAIFSAMEQALSQAELQSCDIGLVMLGGAGHQSELDAAGRLFGNERGAPLLLSSSKVIGELYAAGPVLSAIIAMNVIDSGVIPESVLVPARRQNGGFPGARSTPAGILINALSCEGQCASIILI
ncbi:MAG: beta-ketoacyl synthase N-terminal-like domain-containing protein [Syntrophobacteraceae bacterium]